MPVIDMEALDKQIGANIARARDLRMINQETLAGDIGVTYQQLQKYEAGKNRVAASRLAAIAAALQLPLGFFTGEIPGVPDATHGIDLPGVGPDGIRLLKLFNAIGSPHLRNAALAVANVLAGGK